MGEAAVKVSEACGYVQRRHRRVPLPGRRVLLPGDEHPPAGGAPGHRAGHRARPGRVADPGRLGRAPRTFTQDDVAAQRPRHRGPHQRRGPEPGRLLALTGHHHQVPAGRARASAWTPATSPATPSASSTTTWWPSWSCGAPTARRPAGACCGPSTRPRSPGWPPPAGRRGHPLPPGLRRRRALDQVGRADPRPERGGRHRRRAGAPRPTARRGHPRVQRDVTAEVDGRRYSGQAVGPRPR
jgi:hypothetical protein